MNTVKIKTAQENDQRSKRNNRTSLIDWISDFFIYLNLDLMAIYCVYLLFLELASRKSFAY